jgi:hypothetical protein
MLASTALLSVAAVLSQAPIKPTLKWDFAANVTHRGGHGGHPPPGRRPSPPPPPPPGLMAFKESEFATATTQYDAASNKTQGAVALPEMNETLTTMNFFKETICFSSLAPVSDAKGAFQDTLVSGWPPMEAIWSPQG